MGCSKLKEDLKNCLINLDRRVLITELLDDYNLSYEETNNVVLEYLREQERQDKVKFEKTYVVHGIQEGDYKKEIYKIVEEQKLKTWLKKLKDAEYSLYSVEIAGGAKSAAAVFKPMSIKEGVKLATGRKATNTNMNGTVELENPNQSVKKELKVETNGDVKTTRILHDGNNNFPTKAENSSKKISPKNESSPTKKKLGNKKSTNKNISINNYFAAASSISKKSEDKDSKTDLKSPSSKKMEDFFKKQTEKATASAEMPKKSLANTSIQLFDSDHEDEEQEEMSSDEEEKIEALKRDIISSDVELDEEVDSHHTISAKRRRILDSDDEEVDPPIKQEKLDNEEKTPEEDETYLDEDGFVITKKSKQKAARTKPPVTEKTPPVTIKTSPKENQKANTTVNKNNKKSTNLTAKTKQAGIMNFFSKK